MLKLFTVSHFNSWMDQKLDMTKLSVTQLDDLLCEGYEAYATDSISSACLELLKRDVYYYKRKS